MVGQLKYSLIICFQKRKTTVAFQHVFIHAFSKLSERTKWINPILFEKDLPLKAEHEENVKGTVKE